MTKKIALSPKSQGLIAKLRKIKRLTHKFLSTFSLTSQKTAEKTKLIDWLALDQNNHVNEKAEILLAALNASLLKDLDKSLPNYRKKQKLEEDNFGQSRKLKTGLFGLLTFLGALVFACGGFDGITLIVSLVPMSTPLLFTLGIVFAIISVLAFNAFDLTEIAKNLNLSKKEACHLVDNYLKEISEINKIRSRINENFINHKTTEELEEDLRLIELLIARYELLNKGRDALTKQSASQRLIFTKYFISSLIGLVYFSAGFFAGQALAIAVASLFLVSSAVVFWPIFAASFAVGATAFGVYWFVERPSIDKLVSHWFGLDKEKIDYLCDEQKMESHKTKLENLKINLKWRYGILAANFKKINDSKTELTEIKKRIRELQLDSKHPLKEADSGFFSATPRLIMNQQKTITLREKTLKLIETMKESQPATFSKLLKLDISNNIKHKKVIKWLNQSNQTLTDKPQDDLELSKASLKVALIKELAVSMQLPLTEKKPKEKNSDYNFLYYFLAFAGTIYFGCEGFSGITSILGVFSLHKAAILVIGALFGLVSIIAYHAFDLAEISKNLGIRKKSIPKLVDVYLKEVDTIKQIRRSLTNLYVTRKTIEELDEDLQLVEVIINCFKHLDEERASLTELMTDKKLTVLKYFASGIVGLIYFSTAFFTGQSVAMAFAALFFTAIAPLSWPIIVASTVIGLAALAVYWYVERPSIERFISNLAGLNQDKIEQLCEPEKVVEQKEKLEQLKANILTCKNHLATYSEDSLSYTIQLEAATVELEMLKKELQTNKDGVNASRDSLSSDKPDIANERNSFFHNLKLQPITKTQQPSLGLNI
ncbi:MAG: hypothetical protein H0U70_11155 [Tatlockia sp.]|nr:hypothetical protein [Tatlockia sp.]